MYGHGGDAVQAAFADQADLRWAEQAQQLGTGHAVQQAMPSVPDGAQVLVLYGDVPLIDRADVARLLDAPGRLAVLAAELADPTGYGRIVRDRRRPRRRDRRAQGRRATSSARSAWSTPA